jgi:hypothetical protein
VINLNSPIPPASAAAAAETLFNLISVLIDKDETLARIEQYVATAKAAEVAEAAALAAETTSRQRQADIEAKLQAAQAEREAALEKADAEFGAQRLRVETALAAREARLAEAEGKLRIDADAVTALKEDLERRLSLLRSVSAA